VQEPHPKPLYRSHFPRTPSRTRNAPRPMRLRALRIVTLNRQQTRHQLIQISAEVVMNARVMMEP
jgi:hypothetical protein